MCVFGEGRIEIENLYVYAHVFAGSFCMCVRVGVRESLFYSPIFLQYFIIIMSFSYIYAAVNSLIFFILT